MLEYAPHGAEHLVASFRVGHSIDGARRGEPDVVERSFYMRAVKFNPDVFPWVDEVGNVGRGLPGKDKEPFAGFDVVECLAPRFVDCGKRAGSLNDVMKEIVAPARGTEGVTGYADLASVLIRDEIGKNTAFKRRELDFMCSHGLASWLTVLLSNIS